MPRRRVAEIAPHLQLGLREPDEIGVAGKLDRARLGREGLHHDLAGAVAPAGPPRDLDEELEGALVGPEIGHVHGKVGVDQAHEGHIGKIEALGDHLGADEDIDAAGAEAGEDFAETIFFAHRVGVDALDPGLGQETPHRLLDPLGAGAAPLDFG